MYRIIFAFVFLIFINGCNNSNNIPITKKTNDFSFVEGKIVHNFSNKIVVKLNEKKLLDNASYALKLTQKIIKNSMLLIGEKVYLENISATVVDIRGNEVTFKISSMPKKKNIKVYIPKKSLAITDFDIIGYNDKNISKEIINKLTNNFKKNNQFTITNRERFNAAIKEHKIKSLELSKNKELETLRNVIFVDLILTGSFTKKGKIWNVNLRLIDVKTGVILSAINDRVSSNNLGFRQFKYEAFDENFEKKKLSQGWNMTVLQRRAKGKVKIVKDGANNTKRAIKLQGKLKDNNSRISLINLVNRDISEYKGLEFYAKTDSKTAALMLEYNDKNQTNNYVDSWYFRVHLSNKWKKYRVSFREFKLSKNQAVKNPGGNGFQDLDNIIVFLFGLSGKYNAVGTDISLYMDEIKLYK